MIGIWDGDQMKQATKQIQTIVRADKREWKRTRVRRDMSGKERWAGIELLKEDYKPKLYARQDRFGKPVTLGQRAQATAEYLQEEQLKCRENQQMFDISRAILADLQRKAIRGDKSAINDGDITEEELESIIKNFARKSSRTG